MDKLLRSHEDLMSEKENEILDQLKRFARDKSQAEKELQKLKDKVCAFIIEENPYLQNLLSIVNTKEQELIELRKKYDEAVLRAEDLANAIAAQKAACSELDNWANRFDAQDIAEQKSMLINLIDRITVLDDFTEVTYNLRYDNINKDYINGDGIENPDDLHGDVFFRPGLVQSGMQAKIVNLIQGCCLLPATPYMCLTILVCRREIWR